MTVTVTMKVMIGPMDQVYRDFVNLFRKTDSVESLLPFLRRDFLRVLDHLMTVQRVKPGHFVVRTWYDLLSLCGLSESGLRQERRAKEEQRLGSIEGLKGCSWFKCASFEVDAKDVPLDMFLCSGCHRVAYCRPYCQQR